MISAIRNTVPMRRDSLGYKIGPDRENGILFGMVLAEAGPFKTGRGRFNQDSLQTAVRLLQANRDGTPSLFRHPTPVSDGLGMFLGRIPPGSIRLDGVKLRGDLRMDSTAMETSIFGGRPLGDYLLAISASDSRAAGASLQLKANKIFERDSRGRPLADQRGEPLPPLWMPTSILGCDVVACGDATSSLLGIPRELTEDDLLRLRWRFQKLRAGVDLPHAELLRARNRNRKRKTAKGN